MYLTNQYINLSCAAHYLVCMRWMTPGLVSSPAPWAAGVKRLAVHSLCTLGLCLVFVLGNGKIWPSLLPIDSSLCKCIWWPPLSRRGWGVAKKEGIDYLVTVLLHTLESNVHMGLLPITSSCAYNPFTKIDLNFFSMTDHCQTYLSFPRE